MSNQINISCRNVFKSNNEVKQRRDFTQRWVTLINQRENNKVITKRD